MDEVKPQSTWWLKTLKIVLYGVWGLNALLTFVILLVACVGHFRGESEGGFFGILFLTGYWLGTFFPAPFAYLSALMFITLNKRFFLFLSVVISAWFIYVYIAFLKNGFMWLDAPAERIPLLYIGPVSSLLIPLCIYLYRRTKHWIYIAGSFVSYICFHWLWVVLWNRVVEFP